MPINNSLKEQVRRNMVALISLVVAITSLGYNTWRNEQSEENRTQRLVAIEALLKLGELQQLVYHNHYDHDTQDKGNPRTGWTLVLTIRDIATILDAPLPEASETLRATWADHWKKLGDSTESKDAVEDGIEALRGELLAMLKALD
ncbi:MAG: hypothetical protein OEU90_10775 [Gammaproteobacteria bacterium]|nr:hypothetical protein [Gammaproteobacteria bacterium]MDH3749578.1 hypothetical protein [Gammaproteobacteria bacterium]MDH3805937.1 hypothetical protein [Gammaproteobacteria bacterium]